MNSSCDHHKGSKDRTTKVTTAKTSKDLTRPQQQQQQQQQQLVTATNHHTSIHPAHNVLILTYRKKTVMSTISETKQEIKEVKAEIAKIEAKIDKVEDKIENEKDSTVVLDRLLEKEKRLGKEKEQLRQHKEIQLNARMNILLQHLQPQQLYGEKLCCCCVYMFYLLSLLSRASNVFFSI
jgi:chromosome segregation ATPase